MSTFLRAIRAGAIQIQHGSVLLAHYGRLGTAFDVCSKVVVDVLREEGMFNNNPDVVVGVITQTLCDVRQCTYSLYTDYTEMVNRRTLWCSTASFKMKVIVYD